MQANLILPEELRRNPLFAGLDQAQLSRVLQTAQVIKLDGGEHLFEAQQEARQFFMVRSGAIRLYLSSPDGSEKVLHLVTPGQTFAEAITFMDSQRYPVNASAVGKGEVIAFSNATFREILQESTDTCFRLMADLSAWLKRQIDEIDALTLQNATLRFTNYLLHHIPAGQLHDVQIELAAPKHVIASRLSIKPESFSRILRNMQQSGLISVDSNTICIKDVEALSTHSI
jgi:CRP-like cAMP-binding protein